MDFCEAVTRRESVMEDLEIVRGWGGYVCKGKEEERSGRVKT